MTGIVNIVDLAITFVCIGILMLYFNLREKNLRKMAEDKILNIRGVYLNETLKIKEKEEKEINKIKTIVDRLEEKNSNIQKAQKKTVEDRENYRKEAEQIIQRAEERANKIEDELKEKADKFLQDQKKEIQTKMVDLVMGITQKVISKSLDYEHHKKLVDEAMAEIDGDEEK